MQTFSVSARTLFLRLGVVLVAAYLALPWLAVQSRVWNAMQMVLIALVVILAWDRSQGLFLVQRTDWPLWFLLLCLLAGIVCPTNRAIALHRYVELSVTIFCGYYLGKGLVQAQQDRRFVITTLCVVGSVAALYGDHDADLKSADPDHAAALSELTGYHDVGERTDTTARFGKISVDRVPFFVVNPGSDVRGDMPVVGGHVDIGPTLLYLLGLDGPRVFVGQPLVLGRSRIAVVTPPLLRDSAVGPDRLFVAGRRSLGAGCFTFPSGEELPLERCADLARRAKQEARMSQHVVFYDLAREIADLKARE